MRKITLSFFLFAISIVSFAQTTIQEEVELIQEVFGAEKKSIIEENIDFTGADTDKFWKLYNEYEEQRKVIADERIKLLYRYSTKTGAVSSDQASRLMEKAIPLRAADDNLIMKYYKKIAKSTNPLVATQFYQIEHYIKDGIRFTILDNIDFIQDK